MTAGRDARLVPAGGGPPSEYRHDAGDSREEEPGVGASRIYANPGHPGQIRLAGLRRLVLRIASCHAESLQHSRSRGSGQAGASRAILPSSRRLAPPPAAWAARRMSHRQRRNRCQTKSVIAVSTTTAPITSVSSSGCVNGPPAHPQSGRQATITAALARHRLGP